MKKEVSEECLAYIHQMLTRIYPQMKGEMKKQTKLIMRKLNPPRVAINLTETQTAFLIELVMMSMKALDGKTDEHSERVKATLAPLTEMFGAQNEAS